MIGVGWACYLWTLTDYRGAWPAFADRCATTARHLVAWLTNRDDEARREQLASICSWRARMRWEALHASARAASVRRSEGRVQRVEYAVPGAPLVLLFRPPAHERVVSLAQAGLNRAGARASRYQHALGVRPDVDEVPQHKRFRGPAR